MIIRESINYEIQLQYLQELLRRDAGGQHTICQAEDTCSVETVVRRSEARGIKRISRCRYPNSSTYKS